VRFDAIIPFSFNNNKIMSKIIMSSTYHSVSSVSEVAYKNGRKVKDMEVVRENNNGIVRQFVKNTAFPGIARTKRVHFDLPSSKNKTLGITFRRMPTPYFTRKMRRSKGLRKFGKNRK